ncbi:phosphotransferase family protein [Aquibacillus saliphilus]|uniref:phosphotransferase family protein n=1 Tax=Aquibacillus saliphilus TaxID=1909422 RepID=UPI001CF04F2E|nr:phosphotransferase family protein [Aquibacillus saliphilus]
MEHTLGKEYTITPAGGSTGEAYFAKSETKSLFLKRNSSPFLAVLSAEGIVPKLVWTKRMENGDVITAQEVLDGRELTPEEMKHPKVAKLLSKIHHSTELLDMLMRIGKKPLKPKEIFIELKKSVDQNSVEMVHTEIHQGIDYLEKMLPDIDSDMQVVCHCDMNHNNWLLSGNGQLYLIDWDNARVGDPAMDIGTVLQSYIPENEWNYWLESYGVEKNKQLINRMYWYLIAESISYINWHNSRFEKKEAAQRLKELKRLIQRVSEY